MKTVIGLLLTIILCYPLPCRAKTRGLSSIEADLCSTNLTFFDSTTSELELLLVRPDSAKAKSEPEPLEAPSSHQIQSTSASQAKNTPSSLPQAPSSNQTQVTSSSLTTTTLPELTDKELYEIELLAELTDEEFESRISLLLPELSREERKKYCDKIKGIMASQPLKAQAFFDQATVDRAVELKDTCLEYAELAEDYLIKSGEQILLGSYSEENTTLGTVGGLALSFTGLDILIDVRELSHDLLNPEWSMEWAEKTTLDVIGVLPFSDTVKLAGDVGGIILDISDNGEDILEAAGYRTGLPAR